MTLRIIALDPGGTTGWALADIEEGGHIEFKHDMLERMNHHKELHDTLESFEPDIIVCESFEYRNANRPGLELISVEYIGVMKLFAETSGTPYVMQKAAQGKIRDKPTAFVKPDNLKRLSLYHPNQVHAMDAYGHLLYYIINKPGDVDIILRQASARLLTKGWKV